jgi:hypothetical protein
MRPADPVALGRHEPLDKRGGQTACGIGCQRSEKGATLGDPAQALLANRKVEVSPDQVTGDECQKVTIDDYVGAKQDARGPQAAPVAEQRLERRLGHMQVGEPTTSSRRRRLHALRLGGHRQMAELPAGRDTACGRCAASRSSSRCAAVEASSVGRGALPPTPTRGVASPGQSRHRPQPRRRRGIPRRRRPR